MESKWYHHCMFVVAASIPEGSKHAPRHQCQAMAQDPLLPMDPDKKKPGNYVNKMALF
jgi:hypothetical protein